MSQIISGVVANAYADHRNPIKLQHGDFYQYYYLMEDGSRYYALHKDNQPKATGTKVWFILKDGKELDGKKPIRFEKEPISQPNSSYRGGNSSYKKIPDCINTQACINSAIEILKAGLSITDVIEVSSALLKYVNQVDAESVNTSHSEELTPPKQVDELPF